MDALKKRSSGANSSVANTSMQAMRLALFIGWILFMLSSILHGAQIQDMWGWVALLAGLCAAYLLTRPDTGYTPLAAWVSVVLAAIASTVIFSYDRPAADLWMYLFAALLPAAQMMRGDIRRGVLSGAIVYLIGGYWVWIKEGSFNDYLSVLLLPIVSFAVIAFVQRELDRFVREELLHRSQAEKARLEARASAEAAEGSSKDLAEVRLLCEPLLQGLRDGELIDADLLMSLILGEATIREMIRSPLLQNPVLNSTVLRLRRSGVSVLLLGEAVEGQSIMPINESLAGVLAARISSLQEGDSVTIRMLQGATDAVVSLLVVEAGVRTRVEFANNGSVLTER